MATPPNPGRIKVSGHAGAIQKHVPAPLEWGRFLPEHTTAVSILDRLLHHATVVITNGIPTA
jgi:hypothetical protein